MPLELEQKVRQLAKLPTPPNEESAKAQLIQPILRLLGWPSDDPEHVAFEHQVGSGRVDIALRVKNHFVAFLEAKAPGKSLDNAVAQVLQYAFLGGVDICVLTTGIEWWLYLPREKGAPQKRRFAVLDIGKDSPGAVAEGLHRYVGREALASGSAERSAKDALAELRRVQRLRVEIPKVWKRMTSDPDPALMTLIQDRVTAETGLEADASLVAEALGMNPPGESPPPKKTASGNNKAKPKIKAPQSQTPKKASVKPASWRLWGTETPVSSWRDLLVGVFGAVHSRHEAGFLEVARPLWGKNTPWVSTDPTGWTKSQALGNSGLHVYTNLSAAVIRKRCRRLLRRFGHSGDDLTIRLA